MQASAETLNLQPENTIVVDIGHCGGKFCMYANALGYRTVGIGKGPPVAVYPLVRLPAPCKFNTHHKCTETVQERWALSFKFLWKLIEAEVLDGTGPQSVTLLHADAALVRDFDFPSAPGMDVLVYCWDRGLSKQKGTRTIFEHVVEAAARSSQVKGLS